MLSRFMVPLLLATLSFTFACQTEPRAAQATNAASKASSDTNTDKNTDASTNASATTAGAHRVTSGQVVTQGVPELDPAIIAGLKRYRSARNATFAGFAPSGVLVKTRFGQTDQLHLVTSPGARRTQLTFHAEPIGEVALPNDSSVTGFVFSKDVGGSEFYQLFWYDWGSGEETLLSDGRSRYMGVRFAPRADQFAYTSTERDGVHFDIYVRTQTGEPRRVVSSEGGVYWIPLDFTRDGKRLLALRYVSANRSALYEVDLASAEKRLLVGSVGSDEALYVGAAVYAADDVSVYYTSDEDSELMRLRLLQGDDSRSLSDDIPWSVELLARSPDASRLAFSVNEQGYSQLYFLETKTGTRRSAAAAPQGIVENFAFDPTGSRLGLTVAPATSPRDVFTVSANNNDAARWTFSEVGGLDTSKFARPRLINYPSFTQDDGSALDIPAFVFTPQGPGPHPVVVVIHGGPAAQYRPRFSSTIAYWVNEMGFAVIAPNVRGSAGYGKTYLQLDDGYLREDSVKDIGALLDWIDTQPQFDSEQVAVYGGSYGGYMVLASMVKYPERIAAGIDVVGISNFVTFLENTQAYRRDLRRVEYGDERDPKMREFLEKIAPLNRVENIQRPLLVAQGYNDPRVPASESEQIVSALEARGIPAWYLLFMDEGHGFRKKANADRSAATYAQFLQKHLQKPVR